MFPEAFSLIHAGARAPKYISVKVISWGPNSAVEAGSSVALVG